MDENKSKEVLGDATEGIARASAKQQIIKYVAIWVSLVAAFFIVNTVARTVLASRSIAASSGGYYLAGQPVANGAAGAGGYGAGSCCGGSGTSAQANAADLKQLEKNAIAWYAQNFGDSNVTAQAKDYGCHQQVTIKKDGKPVKELAYRNGQFEVLQ